MDEQIGRVIAALEQKKMLDNTLIIFQSDNDGTHNPMFAGAITDMSKVVLPADNGAYRDQGLLYQGGTFVVAFASWPGHIKEGSTVNEMIHRVDLYPTLVSTLLPRDGVDVWGTISEVKPSPAHGDRLQRRAVPRGHPAGRLEAHLAHAAAAVGRTLQHRRGSFRDESCCRISEKGGGTAEARQSTGCRSRKTKSCFKSSSRTLSSACICRRHYPATLKASMRNDSGGGIPFGSE
jgi:hypothetical protein